MIVLIFALAFVVSYISIYIVSFFSSQTSDPISVFKTTGVLWGASIVLNIFQVTGVIGMSISTIISMVVFMKFLGFEPTPSFFVGFLYTLIYSFLFLLILSIFMR